MLILAVLGVGSQAKILSLVIKAITVFMVNLNFWIGCAKDFPVHLDRALPRLTTSRLVSNGIPDDSIFTNFSVGVPVVPLQLLKIGIVYKSNLALR